MANVTEEKGEGPRLVNNHEAMFSVLVQGGDMRQVHISFNAINYTKASFKLINYLNTC